MVGIFTVLRAEFEFQIRWIFLHAHLVGELEFAGQLDSLGCSDPNGDGSKNDDNAC